MRIAVFGAGYVGLVSACGFAQLGHTVVAVDVDPARVAAINAKKAYLAEPGIAEALDAHVPASLSATTDAAQAVADADVIFVCVGTPTSDSGQQDTSYLVSALEKIGAALKGPHSSVRPLVSGSSGRAAFKLVVIKSTVVPGTTEGLAKSVLEKASGKSVGTDFGLASNPEFLQEANALADFMQPSRIVVGVTDAQSEKMLRQAYAGMAAPWVVCTPVEAELSKYSSNAFLALKISYANELALLCRKLRASTRTVTEAMGLDPRIGPAFLGSGLGWGGSCFPKDTAALSSAYQKTGLGASILDAAVSLNAALPALLIADIEAKTGPLSGKTVAVLGVAFKAGTDDVRDSPALRLASALVSKKAKVLLSDPVARVPLDGPSLKKAKQMDAQAAVRAADLVIIATAWPQFKALDFGPRPVFDARGLLRANPPENYVDWT